MRVCARACVSWSGWGGLCVCVACQMFEIRGSKSVRVASVRWHKEGVYGACMYVGVWCGCRGMNGRGFTQSAGCMYIQTIK